MADLMSTSSSSDIYGFIDTLSDQNGIQVTVATILERHYPRRVHNAVDAPGEGSAYLRKSATAFHLDG
jgi:hypothetical protein